MCESCHGILRRHEASADRQQQLLHMQRPSARDAPQILVLYSDLRTLMDVSTLLVDDLNRSKYKSR